MIRIIFVQRKFGCQSSELRSFKNEREQMLRENRIDAYRIDAYRINCMLLKF